MKINKYTNGLPSGWWHQYAPSDITGMQIEKAFWEIERRLENYVKENIAQIIAEVIAEDTEEVK